MSGIFIEGGYKKPITEQNSVHAADYIFADVHTCRWPSPQCRVRLAPRSEPLDPDFSRHGRPDSSLMDRQMQQGVNIKSSEVFGVHEQSQSLQCDINIFFARPETSNQLLVAGTENKVASLRRLIFWDTMQLYVSLCFIWYLTEFESSEGNKLLFVHK